LERRTKLGCARGWSKGIWWTKELYPPSIFN